MKFCLYKTNSNSHHTHTALYACVCTCLCMEMRGEVTTPDILKGQTCKEARELVSFLKVCLADLISCSELGTVFKIQRWTEQISPSICSYLIENVPSRHQQRSMWIFILLRKSTATIWIQTSVFGTQLE